MATQPLVLLVDDDVVILQVLSKALSTFARIRFAKNGADALKAIADERPALVVLDANMPVMSGEEVLRALRQMPQGQHLPVIVITSDGDSSTESRLLELGAQDFLAKPFRPEQLMARIRAQLRHAQLRADLQDLGPAVLHGGAKVLLVDDDPSALEALQAAITPLDCQISTAADGTQALERMQTQVPDLVLLDVEMPRLDGFAVCQAMQADPLLAQVPVAFVSVLSDDHAEAQSFALGASDYLCKPFRPEVLRARVRKLLHTRSERAEALQAAAAHWQALGDRRVADLVAVASDAILSVDARGHVALINRAAAQLFGVPAERCLGQLATAVLPGWEALELLIGSIEGADRRRRTGHALSPVRLYSGDGQPHVVEPVVFRQGLDDSQLTTLVLRDASDRISAEMRRELHRDAVVAAAAQLALLRALNSGGGPAAADAALLAMLEGQISLPPSAPLLREFDLGVALEVCLRERKADESVMRVGLTRPLRRFVAVGDVDRFCPGLCGLIDTFAGLATSEPLSVTVSLSFGDMVGLHLDLSGARLDDAWRASPKVQLALTELRAGGALERRGERHDDSGDHRLAFQLLRPLVET